MSIKNKVADLYYGAGAALTIALSTNPALAGEGFAGLSDNLNKQMGAAAKLVVGGSFVAGVVLVAGGLMKLKQAVDTQGQQVKYGDGLWRLALGSALVALPMITGLGKDTIFGETQTEGVGGLTDFSVNGGN